MSSVAEFMPGHRASTVESVSVTGRRLAAFLAAIVVGLVRVVVPHIFTIGAFAAFSVAAFLVSPVVGFVTIGVSLLYLERTVSYAQRQR